MSNLLLPPHISRDIPGLEGIYYARTDGQVFSHNRIIIRNNKTAHLKGQHLAQNKHGDGYVAVGISTNNTSHKRYVHRIIALTFIPNPENKPCVNHLDGNKLNNNVWNLAWATYKENTAHAIQTGLIKSIGATHYAAKLTVSQVIEIMESEEPAGVLAKKYGVLSSRISSIKYGTSWKSLREGVDVKTNPKPFPCSRLTEDQVFEIMCSEERDSALARKYNVGQSTIFGIKTGKTWKYITDPMGCFP